MFADSTEGRNVPQTLASFSTSLVHADRSSSMQQVLQGAPEVNRSYFVDCTHASI